MHQMERTLSALAIAATVEMSVPNPFATTEGNFSASVLSAIQENTARPPSTTVPIPVYCMTTLRNMSQFAEHVVSANTTKQTEATATVSPVGKEFGARRTLMHALQIPACTMALAQTWTLAWTISAPVTSITKDLIAKPTRTRVTS